MILNSNDTALQLFCIMVYTVSAGLGLLLAGNLVQRYIFPQRAGFPAENAEKYVNHNNRRRRRVVMVQSS